MGNELMKANDSQYQVQKQKQSNLGVFSDAESFNLAMRMADSLSRSTIVPKDYQQNPSNCMIAIEMASRINTSPMMVMQNLYIVNGRPAWSSQWIIAMINNSKRYKTELKFDLQYAPDGSPLSCMAWAEDFNGNKVLGPVITMEMAKNEGWIGKNGSKWKTMPEVMIRYRAASFFGRLNCPDMIMGIYSQEEVIDGFGDEENDNIITIQEEASEDNRQITQEERQMFLTAIAEGIQDTDRRNQVFVEVIQELGLRSTTNMTAGQLAKAMEIVKLKIEEEHKRQESKQEIPQENPENTNGE